MEREQVYAKAHATLRNVLIHSTAESPFIAARTVSKVQRVCGPRWRNQLVREFSLTSRYCIGEVPE